MMLWDREQKTCQLIEITVPLDTNLKEAYHLKEIKYIPLISEMQRLYKEYKFSTTIITIGALGAVPKILKHNLEKLPLPKERIDIIIQRIQRAAPNWNFKSMQDCHENVERDFMTVDVGQWTLKTLLYCLWPVYTMISTSDKITTYIHTYIHTVLRVPESTDARPPFAEWVVQPWWKGKVPTRCPSLGLGGPESHT